MRLGVAGAGTMGAGIAQLGCQAGIETVLYDPFEEARERGAEYVRKGLEKAAAKGRLDGEPAELTLTGELDALAACDLMIEAVPERPDLKRELFAAVSERNPDAVIATNTSSILVTSLAGAAARPENVVGMHFFNPPPVMKLVEVIPAEQTGEEAVRVVTEVAEAMGRHPIVVTDGPGFLVNRCNRPFGAESLRLLQERVATHEQIDRIVRLGGGFRMGPFELMDLVGIDVGYEVAQSFTEQSFGEPRWKPSPLQARMVAAGKLGRKTGGGWYDYPPGRPDDPPTPEMGGGDGRRVAIDGAGPLARSLRQRAAQAGFDAREPSGFGGLEEPELVIDAAVPGPAADLGVGGADLAIVADRALAETGARTGFHLLPPIGALVELTGERNEEVERFFAQLGLLAEWVADAPGLVLGRIAAQLVNEAAFAIGEGVGSPDDVDAGMTLGLNHPRGPVEWWRAIGTDHVVAVLDALREERYRLAPLLRRGAPPPAARSADQEPGAPAS
ncbi:MAG: 3-hydroxyacyl-CoA dehydrogenase NAD-binding domain-containing protein [Thermoleophilaceae bacterium]